MPMTELQELKLEIRAWEAQSLAVALHISLLHAKIIKQLVDNAKEDEIL